CSRAGGHSAAGAGWHRRGPIEPRRVPRCADRACLRVGGVGDPRGHELAAGAGLTGHRVLRGLPRRRRPCLMAQTASVRNLVAGTGTVAISGFGSRPAKLTFSAVLTGSLRVGTTIRWAGTGGPCWFTLARPGATDLIWYTHQDIGSNGAAA